MTSTSTRPRRRPSAPSLAIVVIVATALSASLLASCSSSTPGATGPGDATNGSGAGGRTSSGTAYEAVTVDHKYGTTVIEKAPTRVVTLGAQWTDVLLALDEQPVGYLVDPGAGAEGRFPWESELAADVTGITGTTSIPMEQVAALHPDLILVTFAATDQGTYDSLTAIAPTVPLLGDRGVDTWEDLLDLGGQIFAKQDQAAAVRGSVDKEVADTATRLPALRGKTFALANYVAGDGIYVVADPEDGASTLFAQLGMVIDPELLAQASDQGRAKLSLEQAPLLDADLLVILANGSDTSKIVGYGSLPAVRSGAVSDMDYAQVSGLNTPSPLSIPYSLDVLMPALEQAAKA